MARTKKGNQGYGYRPMSNKDKEKYDFQKSQMMSQEDLERANVYQEWYMSAWQAKKNRGMFDLWADLDDAWEGNLNIGAYIDDPASNTNIIHPTIEGQVALMNSSSVEIQPFPITPSEQSYVSPVKNILEFIRDNNNYILKKDMFLRRFKKFGTGIYRVLYDKKWCGGFGLPVISACNPFYVFPDPNITDIYDIQDGRFFIETFTKSIVWAEMNFGAELADCIVPNFEPSMQAQYFGEQNYGSGEVANEYYIHVLIFEKYKCEKGKLKLKLTQMSADGTILWDSEKENYSFPDTGDVMFPYFFAPCYYREGTVWGKSDAELLMDPQMQLNDYDDQIRSNARLLGNPQRWADATIVPDIDKWTNEMGLTIPVQGDGRAALGYIPAPQIGADIINRRDRIMDQDRFQLSRFYEQMLGGRIKGVDTATEALSLQNSGMAGVDYQNSLIAKVESNMFEYILECAMFYWKDKKLFQITGKKDFMSFNPSTLNKIPEMIESTESFISQFKSRNKDAETPAFMNKVDKEGNPKYKKAKFRIDIKLGAGTPKNAAFMYQMMKEMYAMKVISLQEFRKYMVNEMQLPIEENIPGEVQEFQELEKQNMVKGGPQSNAQAAMGTTNPTGVTKNPSANVQGVNANGVISNSGGGM